MPMCGPCSAPPPSWQRSGSRHPPPPRRNTMWRECSFASRIHPTVRPLPFQPCQQIRMLNMAATCRGVRSPSCDGATAALD